MTQEARSEPLRLDMTTMPCYQCHKEVGALKIAHIELTLKHPTLAELEALLVAQEITLVAQEITGVPNNYQILPSGEVANGGAILTPAEEGYAPVTVDGAYMRKHTPHVGGYFVVYKDGYQSFSPAEAFEEGYTRKRGS